MNKELYNKIKKLTDKDIETLNAFLSSRLTDAHNHNHYQQWYHMETYSRMSPYFIAAIGLDTQAPTVVGVGDVRVRERSPTQTCGWGRFAFM